MTSKQLDDLRVARALYHLSLTDIALAASLPRWRVQQIFAGSHSPAKPGELRLLRQAVRILQRHEAKKKALLERIARPARSRRPSAVVS